MLNYGKIPITTLNAKNLYFLCVFKRNVLFSVKNKVQNNHPSQTEKKNQGGFLNLFLASSVRVSLDGDGPDGDEEDPPDQVDEQLQDGKVGAQEVGHQHSWSNDSKPGNNNINE